MKTIFAQPKAGTSTPTIPGLGFRTLAAMCSLHALFLAQTGLAQLGFVLDTGHELSLIADFNGDDFEDAVVVEKDSGLINIAIGDNAGSLNWRRPRSSGMAYVSGIAAGRWGNLNADSLAFAGPDANRIHWIESPGLAASAHSMFRDFFIDAVRPVHLVALDVGGPGNTPFDDFIVGSVSGPGLNSTLTSVRNGNGNPGTGIQELALGGSATHWNRISLIPGPKRFLACLHSAGGSHELRAYDFALGVSSLFSRLTNLPPTARYIVGGFGPANSPVALVYQPGSLHVRAGPLQNPASASLGVTPDPGISNAIGNFLAWRIIPSATDVPRILSFGTKPGAAAILSFDGSSSLKLDQVIGIPDGGTPTGMFTHSDGTLHLLTGEGGLSDRFHRYKLDGKLYQHAQSGPIPKLPPTFLNANVFQFDDEPFVSSQPRLLRTDLVSDWARQVVLGGSVGVVHERFSDEQRGLDDPANVLLGAPHPQADFALGNQYREDLSLVSVSRDLGLVVSEVSISPAPGSFRTGVTVQFNFPPFHQVLFRNDTLGAWQPYSSPFQIHQSSAIEYYGKPLFGTAKSVIHRAHYEILSPPGRVDSDGDGVPDLVEQHLKLNPTAGGDSDKDSFSDLEEILAGTKPDSAASKPEERPSGQADAGRRILLEPRPLHPVTGSVTGAVALSSLRLHGLDGNLLGAGRIPFSLIGLTSSPTAILRGIRPDDGIPFMIASTEPHFGIQGQPGTTNGGRELVRVLRLDPPASPTVNFQFDPEGMNPDTAAMAWIESLKTAMHAAEPPALLASLSATDALIARLFERGTALALISRGVTNAQNLTLFPFRVSEAGRWTPPLDIWRGGARFDASTNPPPPLGLEELASFHHAVSQAIQSPQTPEFAALTDLVVHIYLLSSRSNDIMAGRYPLPFDAVREWVWENKLPGGYDTDIPLDASLRTLAAAGVVQALALMPLRTKGSWILRVRPDSFAGFCATLETTTEPPQAVHLFDANGAAFVFPDSFSVLPGTLVQIEGYPTLAAGPCDGTKVEVTAATLLTLPPATLVDTDQNGISDDWERLFLGGIGGNPFADTDKDNVVDLLEFLGGSDPTDPGGVPLIPVPDLTPPELKIKITESGEVEVEWRSKGGFQHDLPDLDFILMSGSTLDEIRSPVARHPVLGNEKVSIKLPAPVNANAVFYRLGLCWGGCGIQE